MTKDTTDDYYKQADDFVDEVVANVNHEIDCKIAEVTGLDILHDKRAEILSDMTLFEISKGLLKAMTIIDPESLQEVQND